MWASSKQTERRARAATEQPHTQCASGVLIPRLRQLKSSFKLGYLKSTRDKSFTFSPQIDGIRLTIEQAQSKRSIFKILIFPSLVGEVTRNLSSTQHWFSKHQLRFLSAQYFYVEFTWGDLDLNSHIAFLTTKICTQASELAVHSLQYVIPLELLS